jgi:hypothetical protein
MKLENKKVKYLVEKWQLVDGITYNARSVVYIKHASDKDCYRVVSHRASHTLRLFLIYCASSFEFQSFLIHPPELSGRNHQKCIVAKQEKLGEK